MLTWSNPWPTLLPSLGGFFTVILAIELVIALVKGAATADADGGDL